ncbi:DUF72 domain-containing protein [Polaromonas sp.]|uniref:DUF72 domain-containing protein n=1 Tax=Polaromonas sp. TaxID=1869339 RepID=UPI0032667205
MQSEAHPDPACAVKVGCAGWSLPRDTWPEFPPDGSHLERYAARFSAVEINSSFYRPHQPTTYARWADGVPADFRFSVKLPKTITHEKRLRQREALLDVFLEQAGCLGKKLGCLLVQLPPSLAFDPQAAESFLAGLRHRHGGGIALEPRHASWFSPAVDDLLKAMKVSRVLADPVLFDAARYPGGYPGLVYVRLHGSPRMYYSAYAPDVLDALAVRLKLAAASDASAWCIFDNTANGAAAPDALRLTQTLQGL